MRRILILGAAVLFVLAAPASAHSKHAKVSRAHLEATEAATTAGIPDARGRAHLVDGRKNDKVSLHMKGLEPGETYLWHVHQATAEGDPCAAGSTVGNPTPYPSWTYRELTARPSGNANSKGRSTTFPVAEEDTGGDYYVNVHLEDGTVIACGVLEPKRRGHQNGDKGHRGKDHGDKDRRGNAHGDKDHRGKGHSKHGNGKGHGHDHHEDD
jgi:hypothetical protein